MPTVTKLVCQYLDSKEKRRHCSLGVQVRSTSWVKNKGYIWKRLVTRKCYYPTLLNVHALPCKPSKDFSIFFETNWTFWLKIKNDKKLVRGDGHYHSSNESWFHESVSGIIYWQSWTMMNIMNMDFYNCLVQWNTEKLSVIIWYFLWTICPKVYNKILSEIFSAKMEIKNRKKSAETFRFSPGTFRFPSFADYHLKLSDSHLKLSD
jgi:hypothetical protein